MHRMRHWRRHWVGLALAAALWMQLVPVLSHAAKSRAAGGWMELCTAVGSRWLLVDASGVAGHDAPQSQTPAAAVEHCPYCTLQSLGPIPIAEAGASALLALDGQAPRLVAASAPRAPQARRAFHPRGPPSSA